MRLKGRVFLVDIDGTLVNASKIKSYWRKFIGNNFDQEYQNSKKKLGHLEIRHLSKSLHVDEGFFYQTPFSKFLYTGALAFLKKLKKLGKVIIFTQGDLIYQKYKFQNSGIAKITGKDNYIVTKDKIKKLQKIALNLITKYSFVTLIDNRLDVLEEANKLNSNIITVWVKHGNSDSKDLAKASQVNLLINNLSRSTELISKFIKTLPQEELNCKLSVIKGINQNYLRQLVDLTNRDSKIKKNTHDIERFSKASLLRTWLKRKREIYILTNAQQRLMGIIWFTKKKYQNSNWTFAIRLYSPARGKGLALKFMKIVFDDFDSKNNTDIWLSTDAKNTDAQKLYSKFGFLKQEIIDNKVFMTRKI